MRFFLRCRSGNPFGGAKLVPQTPRLPPMLIGAFGGGPARTPPPLRSPRPLRLSACGRGTGGLGGDEHCAAKGVPRRELESGGGFRQGADEAMRGRRSGRKNQVQPRQRHADFFGSPQAGLRGGRPPRIVGVSRHLFVMSLREPPSLLATEAPCCVTFGALRAFGDSPPPPLNDPHRTLRGNSLYTRE